MEKEPLDVRGFGLGRVEPKNFDHVSRNLYTAPPPFKVEKNLVLPAWHKKHNQGEEGACVGFGVSLVMAMINLYQCWEQGAMNAHIRYNPWWLWDRSKEVDGFPETNPGDQNGTTVSAAMQIVQSVGHVCWDNEEDPWSFDTPKKSRGFHENKWARFVDQIRAAVADDKPVAAGTIWYGNFDQPVFHNGEWWIGRSNNLGPVRGGHCYAWYGASDERQAVRVKNSWGEKYPEVWMPYDTAQRLLNEGGEATLVTDL